MAPQHTPRKVDAAQPAKDEAALPTRRLHKLHTADSSAIEISTCQTIVPFFCPICQQPFQQQRHCKLLCAHCGYVESCEDLMPFGSASHQVNHESH